ncbi:MAG TPA: hypothetical protein VFS43_22845 [Polyangiaceae bacterium]|nr:hypothetical protein [Polyangiaceae bacterium]
MALAAGRKPPRLNDIDFHKQAVPVAANTTIFQGAMVDKAATGGMAKPGAANTTDKCLGVAQSTVVNGAVAGANKVVLAYGVWKMRNSSAGDLITEADIGNDCFLVDDETVARTNGTNTRHVAGEVYKLDADGGVFVHFKP